MNFDNDVPIYHHGNKDSWSSVIQGTPVSYDNGVGYSAGLLSTMSGVNPTLAPRRPIMIDNGTLSDQESLRAFNLEQTHIGNGVVDNMNLWNESDQNTNDWIQTGNGIGQSGNSWTPVTSENVMNERSNMTPVDVQENRVEAENWQDLVGMYTGLLQENTLDTSKIFEEINPTPSPPIIHNNVNQNYVANPTQYRNHTSNQASTSHSYLNSIDPANWKCNHLAAVASPSSSSARVLPANVAQNNGVCFSNRPLTSNRQSQVESQGMRSTCWSSVLGIQETPRLASNNLINNRPRPKDGFSVTYQTRDNESSPPRFNRDAQTSSIGDSFPFAPITPDNQRKHMEGQWVPENVNFPVAEISTPAKVTHENQTVSINDAENLYNELLQTIGDSPASAISATQKEHIVSEERDAQEIDLTQTPLQNTPRRRKKHRPKVIRERKPKRAPMQKDPGNGSPSETQIKRKYVRKKGVNENTPVERVKRKYVRKKVADHLEPAERVGKQKYTRKKGVDHLESQQHSKIDDNVASVTETPPKSCKRQLNFDLEHVAQNESRDIKSSQQVIDVQASSQNKQDRRTRIYETPGNTINKYQGGTTQGELNNQMTPLNVIQTELANRLVTSESVLSLDEKRGMKRQNFNVNAMELYKRLLLGDSHHAYERNTLNGILLANHKKMKMQSELQARDDNSRQMNGIYMNVSAMQLLNSCTGRVNPSYVAATHYLQRQQMLSRTQPHTMRSMQETSQKYTQGAIVNWNPSPPTPPKGFFRYAVTTYPTLHNKQIAKPNSYNQRLNGINEVLHQHRNAPLKGYQQSPPVARGRPRKQNGEISVADITRKLEGLHIYDGNKAKQNELVLYRGSEAMIPFESSKKRIPRPKVDLDPETERLWRVLMGIEGSEGAETINKDKEKWWEDERRVFRGRADSFIARMHLVQGDRRFSRWKGSVVDSVIGVFLTQNVSDHLSSSAFMSLAARFPLKSTTANETCCQDGAHEGPIEVAERILEEKVVSQDSVNSSTIQTVDEFRSSSGSNSEAEDVTNGFETCTQSGSSVIIQKKMPAMLNDVLPTNMYQLPKEPECILQIPTINSINLNSSSQFQMGKTPGLQKVGSPSFEVLGESTSSLPSPNSGVTEAYDTCNLTNPQNETRNVAQKQDSAMFGELFEDRVSVEDKQICFETTATEANSKQQNTSHEPPSGPGTNVPKAKKGTVEDARRRAIDWDSLRKEALLNSEKKERSKDATDSLDYEAVRCAHVNEISDAIKERGMNNLLADRMKDFLNRIVRDHGAIDLEWLRDAPPDKAKDYLLSFRGLGLKSVECVRLLTLHHLAFPVDTNVGRIAVRLGWVPLQPLPESLQLHLLEMYPVLESIQKYLWPRLCKLDQLTLYELHYQMITFGKVFCTKSKPNCNACPMRAECRHFASAFASARLSLPGPEEKRIVTSNAPLATDPVPPEINSPMPLPLPLLLPPTKNDFNKSGRNCEPIIEEPTTPEPEPTELSISDIEDQYYEDSDEIPSIKLNMEEFTTNLQNIMQDGKELQDNMSKALVALNPNAPSIPTPKLKDVSRLRTEHLVYELPDSHQLLEGLDKREPDDPSHYLLAIWTPGETATSVHAPEIECLAQQSGQLCDRTTCFSCNNVKEANLQVVRGTILIPCRTAMRGSFPLNGTYFQVNEMFADHASSLKPIDVPRSWIWNLPRRTVYFGTSVSTIFKGLTTEGIQYCFWRGFVCVRGFDRIKRSPRPLMARLHFPVSKLIAQKAAKENK